MVAVALLALLGCAAARQPQRNGDEWAFDGKAHELESDPDAAEVRWRKEIAAQQWTDEQDMLDRDKLLTDDPPGPPSSYGKVASANGDDAEVGPQQPRTLWQRFQAGADSVGKATFAAFAVVVTLGMMVAPYLLL